MLVSVIFAVFTALLVGLGVLHETECLALWRETTTSLHWFAAVMLALYFVNYLTVWRSMQRLSLARKASREFAPKVAGALRERKFDEAIQICMRHRESHLAEIVRVGLVNFRPDQPGTDLRTIDLAMGRAQRQVNYSFRRMNNVLMLWAWATGAIGSLYVAIALFVNFTRLNLPADLVTENALLAIGFTLFAAAPAFFGQRNIQVNLESREIETANSHSELLDYLSKQTMR
jgi:biopolymer transport protein ExbB